MAVLREAFTGCRLPLPHLPLPGIQTLDPETVMLEHYSMMGSIISEETRETGVLPPFRQVLERYSRMVYWRSFLSTQANALVELGVTGDPEVPGTFFEVCPPGGSRYIRPFVIPLPSTLAFLNSAEIAPPSLFTFFPVVPPSEPCIARFPYFDRPSAAEPSFPPAPAAAFTSTFVHRPSALPEEVFPDRPAEPLVVLVLPDEPRTLPRPWYLESEVDHEGSSSDDSLAVYDDMSESSGDSNLAVCRANRP